MQIVYQVSAHEYTPKQAADEFARTWFSEPREVDVFENDRFTLVNGRAEYIIVRVPEIHLVSCPVLQIQRL